MTEILKNLQDLKNSMDLEAYQKDLQSKLDEFKKEIKSLSVPDGSTLAAELKSKEESILDTLKEFDNYIKDVKYELPTSTVFEGASYNKNKISEKIIYYLNKIDVEWQHTLGMYQLVDFWKKSQSTDTIPYGVLDSTLRCLGGLKFKGFNEWSDILAINEYFKQLNEEFGKDIATSIYIAQIHSAIMDEMQMNLSETEREMINEKEMIDE